ncbi:MAG TPA: lysylphosphatidylglycerol synthase domain-containing protein [Gemmataceae bacterium]|nr:lysylphosphatidylglycerol synthase domain-containing protein [Gemmataceae bacterium]
MRLRLSRWVWPVCKALLALAIVAAVGWQFWRDLSHEQLQNIVIKPQWLVLSALLYACGQGFSGWYWYRLLVTFGEKPRVLPALRAYYISQLGKYLPGKAWALMMRGTLIRGPDVKLGVALIATFYEVLTTMASGAMLAAVLFTLWPPRLLSDALHPAWFGLMLLALCGLPLVPAVFNGIVGRLGRRFQTVESFKLPRLNALTLIEGLATTSAVWICFGLSLWAMLQGNVPDAPDLSVEWWGRCTAIMALACVGGFVVIVVPGGIGVREWVLDRFLAPELAAASALAVVIVLLLRVVWTAAEVVVAGLVWFLPGPRRNTA